MLIIYSYEEPDDVVLIVAFQDALAGVSAPRPRRPGHHGVPVLHIGDYAA